MRKGITFFAVAGAMGLSACSSPPPYSNTAGYPESRYPDSRYPSATYPDNRARYGYVEAVEVVPAETRSTGPGIGAIGGAIAGGVLGSQIGHGAGRAAAAVGGAVAGGVIGHEVEQRVKGPDQPTMYRFRVKMDDGSYQSFTQETHDNIRVGDRVRIENGRVWAS
jgi:outer membrane lipoprotein SlyB